MVLPSFEGNSDERFSTRIDQLGKQLLSTDLADRTAFFQDLRNEFDTSASYRNVVKILIRYSLSTGHGSVSSLAQLSLMFPGVERDLLEELVSHSKPITTDSIATLRADGTQDDMARISSMDSESKKTLTVNDASNPSGDRQRFSPKSEHAIGGLGIVFQAEDRQLDRIVALKQIRAEFEDDPAYREKFLREAMVTGKLEHPSIVPVYALGTDERGRPYYVMRFIKGQTLKERIEAFHQGLQTNEYAYDSMSLRKLLRRFIDVCQAIDYAHSRGVIHRDVKPSNIMLGKFGETLVVDWGLARQFDANSKSDPTVRRNVTLQSELPLATSDTPSDALTRMGSFVGSVPYASPEQLRGDLHSLGPRSDIYSLGAVLFEILVGRTPVADISSEKELADEILLGKLPSPRQVQPLVPKALDAICRKAMAGRISDRYQTADDLRLDIEAFLDDEKVSAWSDGFVDRLGRILRKRPALFSTVAVSSVATIGFLGFVAWYTALDNLALERAVAQADANAREASEQRTFARETISNLAQLVNEGQAKGNDIQAIRQDLFAELVRRYEALTSEKSVEVYSRLGLLQAKVGLAKSVARLGKWHGGQQLTFSKEDNAPAQLDQDKLLKREVDEKWRRVYSQQSVSIADSDSGKDVSDEAEPIMSNSAISILRELENSDPMDFRVQTQLLQLYLENAIACREIDLFELSKKQLLEISARCDRLMTALPEDLNELAQDLKLVQLQALRQQGLADLQTQQYGIGLERLQTVLVSCRKAAQPDQPRFQLLLAEVLNDLGSIRPNEESPSEWYSRLDESNTIAKEITNSNLLEQAQRLRYDTLMRMSFMKEPSEPDIAEGLRKEARDLVGVTPAQQQESMYPNDLRRQAWNMIYQADSWEGIPEKKLSVRDLYNQALYQLEKVYRAKPASREARRDLATAHERLGLTSLREFELGENGAELVARQQFERMLELKKDLATDQDDWLAQVELSITYSHFADLELIKMNLPQAIRWTNQRIEILEPARKRFPSESSISRHLMLAHWDLGQIHQRNLQYFLAKEYCTQALDIARNLDMGLSRVPYVEQTKRSIEDNIGQLEGYIAALLPMDQVLKLPHSKERTSIRQSAILERIIHLKKSRDWAELSRTLDALNTEPSLAWIDWSTLISGYTDLALLADNLAKDNSDLAAQLLELGNRSRSTAGQICQDALQRGVLTLSQLRQSPTLNEFRSTKEWEKINQPDSKLHQILSSILPYASELRVVNEHTSLTLLQNDRLPNNIYTCEFIDLSGTEPVPDDVVESLCEVLGLQELKVEAAPWFRNEQLASVAKCNGLRTIGLGGNPQIDATGLGHLSSMDSLRVLYLGRTKVNLAMAEALSKLPNVDLLDLNGCGVDDRSLPFVAQMKSLRNLCLTNNAITDAGIQHIINLPLTTLRLAETDITDSALPLISQIKTLDTLTLTETNITEAAIESFLRLPNLAWLQIDRNPIGAEAIASLAKLGNLKRLEIEGCPVSSDQLDWLKKQLPFCNVNVNPMPRERATHGRPPIAEGDR